MQSRGEGTNPGKERQEEQNRLVMVACIGLVVRMQQDEMLEEKKSCELLRFGCFCNLVTGLFSITFPL